MKCSMCGICCKLFMINLTEEEFRSGNYDTQFRQITDDIPIDFTEAEMCGHNIISQKKDGSCIYLKDGRCSIHDKRPLSCRNFFCDSKNPQFKSMIQEINKIRR